jgi:hypothetical protein
MWTVVVFRIKNGDIESARRKRDRWIQSHPNYEIREVFVNNALALDVRKLRTV